MSTISTLADSLRLSKRRQLSVGSESSTPIIEDHVSAIVVIGEAVVDAFIQSEQHGAAGSTGLAEDRRGAGRSGQLCLRALAGGGPANTAVALGRLGTPVRFLGRLTAGPLGDLLRQHLLGSGVDLSGSVAAAQPPTLAVASVDPEGTASYSFYLRGTADWQWTASELAGWRRDDVVAVHAGSLALALAPGGPRIEEVLRHARDRATVSIDPNVRPGLLSVADYRRLLTRWGQLADVIRMSEDDLRWLGLAPEPTCAALHEQGVRLVIVTQAAAGAYGSLDGERVRVPGPDPDIVPVDTVGAGDAFNAGLLHSLHAQGHLGGRLTGLTREQLVTAMIFAVLVAGRTCQVAGADPPWAWELPAAGPDHGGQI